MGRAEFVKFFVGILVQTMKPKGHFEINWPLVKKVHFDHILALGLASWLSLFCLTLIDIYSIFFPQRGLRSLRIIKLFLLGLQLIRCCRKISFVHFFGFKVFSMGMHFFKITQYWWMVKGSGGSYILNVWLTCTEGQLISKELFGVIVSTKRPTKFL